MVNGGLDLVSWDPTWIFCDLGFICLSFLSASQKFISFENIAMFQTFGLVLPTKQSNLYFWAWSDFSEFLMLKFYKLENICKFSISIIYFKNKSFIYNNPKAQNLCYHEPKVKLMLPAFLAVNILPTFISFSIL